MSFPREIISEKKKPSAAEIRRAGEEALKDEQNKNKSGSKGGDLKKKSEYTKYLSKQLKYKKKKYEEQKKKELENIKKRATAKHVERAKAALKSIKQEPISDRENEASAYGKAVGNVASLAGGLAAAGYHGARALVAKEKAKKKSKERREEQPQKKEPGKPGRRRSETQSQSQTESQPQPQPQSQQQVQSKQASAEPKKLEAGKERKRLLPSTKRLPPATKKLPPSGGVPYQAPPQPSKQTGMSLGQRARRNPELKKRLISAREEYSDWKTEFLFENGLILEIGSDEKVTKEKVIDIMKGKNSIDLTPEISEDHKQIESGEKKDDEGYMANVELDQMERAIKALRKKIKKSDTQMPAWVQSKITRAADYIDTASDYMMSEDTLNEFAPVLSRLAMRTAVVSSGKDILKDKLKDRVKKSLTSAGGKNNQGNVTIDPEDNESNAYGKALSNIISVGEEFDLNESKKSKMKCNKPKAEAHGSGETGKSHVVKACEGGKEKLIRFGQLGVKGSPKKEGESKEYSSRRHRFQTRHAKNIAKGKMSAAYWANKVKW